MLFFSGKIVFKRINFHLKDGRRPHDFDSPIGTALQPFDKKGVRGDSQPSPVARKQIVYLPPTDYGRPLKPFFKKIPNFWAWADNLGR